MMSIHETEREIKRGDVYWCEFQYGTGSEQVGTRPVVIVSNDICNETSTIVTVVPLTSSFKRKMPTHTIVRATNKESTALAEQVFTVDKERIGDYINRCTADEMERIEKCLKIQIGVYDFEAEAKKRAYPDGVKVISRGYEFFRKKCECCGAVYEYTFEYTIGDHDETKCPECGYHNIHNSALGVECVERS